MADPTVIEITSSPAPQSKVVDPSHRLPTVSASQALFDLQDNGAGYISTGLATLDLRLCSTVDGTGGIERGKVTEIWGPCGAGKTAIALQTAASAVNDGARIVWIDGVAGISDARLRSVITDTTAAVPSHSTDNQLSKFKCLHAATFSHLLALTIHTRSELISKETGLLVVDGLDILLDLDYPRQQFAGVAKTDQQKWQSSRRYGILGSLVSALSKLAVLNNLAVIVTTGCSTRPRPDSGLGAALAPGVGGTEWESGIWNRLVVFRDFSGRFVGIQKSQGKSNISREEVGETGRIIAFDVNSHGTIQEQQLDKGADGATAALVKARISPLKPRKRAFDEIADSDGEDVDEYGWAEADDDALAAEGLIDDGTTAGSASESK